MDLGKAFQHIHVVIQVIEKPAEYDKPLCIAFIDYEKAFDSVGTAAALETFKHQGIEETCIRSVEGPDTGRIILHKKSEKFPIRKGVLRKEDGQQRSGSWLTAQTGMITLMTGIVFLS